MNNCTFCFPSCASSATSNIPIIPCRNPFPFSIFSIVPPATMHNNCSDRQVYSLCQCICGCKYTKLPISKIYFYRFSKSIWKIPMMDCNAIIKEQEFKISASDIKTEIDRLKEETPQQAKEIEKFYKKPLSAKRELIEIRVMQELSICSFFPESSFSSSPQK